MYDLVIRRGTVVTEAQTAPLDIAVKGESIAAVEPPGGLGDEAKRVIDASNCHGGTTTIIDFAVQEPPTSLSEAIHAKKQEATSRMAVDCSFHALLTGEIPFDVMDEIGDAIRDGIPTIKTMMTYNLMTDDGYRFGVMQEVAEHSGLRAYCGRQGPGL